MTPLRIMHVEDERLIVLSVQFYLEDMGHQICAAPASAEEALELFDNLLPDVVILDIRLAGSMTGYTLGRTLRGRSDVPLIFCSACGTDELDDELLCLPRVGFLRKPVDRDDLGQLLSNFFPA